MIPHSILIVSVLATFSPAIAQPRTITGKVTHVRDGDTIEVNGVPIRLDGLHAPELHEPGGHAARAWMVRATAGRVVVCHLTGERTRDRNVGRCYVGGADLAAGLISSGLARDCARYSGGRYRALEAPAAATMTLPSYCVRRR